MAERVWISVNGTPLTTIGDWGSPVLSWRWPGGSWEMSWQMRLPIGFRHPSLVRNADVIAYIGPSRIWRGFLSEPDWDSGEFVALGVCRQGETSPALDALDRPTATPTVAIDQARALGFLWWTRSALYPISSTPFVEGETDRYNSVSDLMNAWSESESLRWWVDPHLYVRADVDPTTPRYAVTPGAGVLGVADEEYVTHIFATYSPKPGKYATVTAVDTTQNLGRSARHLDLTNKGFISAAQAQATVDGILAKTKARIGWTNGLTVGYGQVLTTGGSVVALSQLRAGNMVRLSGLFDERGLSAYTDIVIAQSTWNVVEQTVQLEPVGMAARDFASIVEAAGGVAL